MEEENQKIKKQSLNYVDPSIDTKSSNYISPSIDTESSNYVDPSIAAESSIIEENANEISGYSGEQLDLSMKSNYSSVEAPTSVNCIHLSYLSNVEDTSANNNKLIQREGGTDWNGIFQEILSLPQSTVQEKIEKLLSIQKLFLQFEKAATSLGRIIISEVQLENSEKTIKSQAVGGIAGGGIN